MADSTPKSTQTTIYKINIRWNLVPKMLKSVHCAVVDIGRGMMASGEKIHWPGSTGRHSEVDHLKKGWTINRPINKQLEEEDNSVGTSPALEIVYLKRATSPITRTS